MRRADEVDLDRHLRVEVVVERIAERRREHDRAGGSGLVMVVDDLRETTRWNMTRFMLVGLGQVRHVEIAVVVVAGVLVVQAWQLDSIDRRVGSDSRMYQFDTSSMPSGLACTHRMITSSRKRERLGVGAADQLVDDLDQLVRAEHLGRVQAAVDPDDRLAFLRERVRLIVGQPLGAREARARSPCSDRAS